MKVIVCLDDNNGMLFNKRRQSQDSLVRKDIIEQLHGSGLWMNEYSMKQFKEYSQSVITVDEQCLECAADTADYCFVENLPLEHYADKITELIVYYWNRKYPADFRLDLDLNKWNVLEQQEFAGNSHEKITKIIYIRNEEP